MIFANIRHLILAFKQKRMYLILRNSTQSSFRAYLCNDVQKMFSCLFLLSIFRELMSMLGITVAGFHFTRLATMVTQVLFTFLSCMEAKQSLFIHQKTLESKRLQSIFRSNCMGNVGCNLMTLRVLCVSLYLDGGMQWHSNKCVGPHLESTRLGLWLDHSAVSLDPRRHFNFSPTRPCLLEGLIRLSTG